MRVKSRVHITFLCAIFQVGNLGKPAYAGSTETICLPVRKNTDFNIVNVFSLENDDIVIEYNNVIRNWGRVRFFNLSQRIDLSVNNSKEMYRDVHAETAYIQAARLKPLESTLFNPLTLANGFTVRREHIFTGKSCWWPFASYLLIEAPGGVSKEFSSLTTARRTLPSVNIACEGVYGSFRIYLKFEDASVAAYRTPRGGLLLTFSGVNCVALFDNPGEVGTGKIAQNLVILPTSDLLTAYGEMAEGAKSPQAAISEVESKAASILNLQMGIR